MPGRRAQRRLRSIRLGDVDPDISDGPLDESADSGDGLAHDQGVDFVGAFVGVHRLQIGHVTEGGVFEGDPVGSENGTGSAGDFESIANVVEFSEGDLLGRQGPGVLTASEMECDQRASLHRDHHFHQLPLRELE